MNTSQIFILALGAAMLTPAPVIANSGAQTASPPVAGRLGTMPHGTYQCALPGDAGGDAYRAVPAENFRITTASGYATQQGSGVYIMRGRELTFTRGPRSGQRFRRMGDNQLRRIGADGKLSDLLCTRISSR